MNDIKRWLCLLIIFPLSLFIPLQASSVKKKERMMSPLRPETVHFVYGLWDKTPLPPLYEQTYHLWELQGWKVKLWTLNDVKALLRLPQYAHYKKIYESLPRNIQKADFIRYLIVYHAGGFYFDLDCQPTSTSLLQALRSTLHTSKDIFFLETITSEEFAREIAKLYPIRKGIPEATVRISNFAFGCHKGSPTLKKILELAAKRCKQNPVITCEYDVLYTTGPDCVTEVISQQSSSVKIINETYLYMTHLALHDWYNNKDKGQ